MIDRFIKENKGCVSGSEVAILEGWKESVAGIFEVKLVDRNTIRLFNLVDKAEYVNMGRQGLKGFRPGVYVVTRLVPLDDIYLLSGVALSYPPEGKPLLEKEALRMTKSNPPAALGKNREKFSQAWQMQKKLRSEFVSYFGDEVIIVPGEKLGETMEGFFAYYTERTKSKLPASEKPKYESIRPPAFPVPEELAGADTVGIIFDETEGLNFFSNFQLFAAPFENPGLIKDRVYREVVMGIFGATPSLLCLFEKWSKSTRKTPGSFCRSFSQEGLGQRKGLFALMKKYVRF